MSTSDRSRQDPETSRYNDTDVTFVQSMILRHRQAVDMAALAEARACSPAVKAIAATITQARAPEIDEMSYWLTDWGLPVPSASTGGGSSETSGWVSEQEMTGLQTAAGADFDRMFLTMMIRHHQDGVQMATAERQQGFSAAANALAEKIQTDQNGEISPNADPARRDIDRHASVPRSARPACQPPSCSCPCTLRESRHHRRLTREMVTAIHPKS
jgi:uncharacterized protein (DUF305 family)